MARTVGMILCGGFGKRLRPITEKIPKPLVEIKDNYTILDKQLFDFKSAGVESSTTFNRVSFGKNPRKI